MSPEANTMTGLVLVLLAEVTVGETLFVPPAATVPIELMLTEVAFWVLHCNVELCPELMVDGVAVKVEITGTVSTGEPLPTVTVTDEVSSFTLLRAVRV